MQLPPSLPGVAFRRMTPIADPVALAARRFRQIYTDAMTERGTGGSFAIAPDRRRLSFVFNYYSRSYTPSQALILDTATSTLTEIHISRWGHQGAPDYPPHQFGGLAWSHDGRRLLFTSRGRTPTERTPWSIWSCRLDGGDLRRLTPLELSVQSFALSPDGRRIACVQMVAGSGYGDLVLFDPARKRRRRLVTGGVYGTPAWSPDGQWIAFTHHLKTHWRLEAIRRDGTGRRTLLDVARLRRPGRRPDYEQVSGVVWETSQSLLVTLYRLDRGENPQAFDEIWRVGGAGEPTLLGPGAILASSADGRILALRFGDGQFWLCERVP